HLERCVVLVALVPGARREDAYRVRAFGDVAQLERLIEVVVGLVGLIVEDDVDVVALHRRGVVADHRRRVFAGLVAFEFAAEVEFQLDGRAADGRALFRLHYLERGLGILLLAARGLPLFHLSRALSLGWRRRRRRR